MTESGMFHARLGLRLLLLNAAAWLVGCTSLLGGVEVKEVSRTVEKPSNVAVYLSVTDSGEPISNLTADNFTLFENEQVVPILDSQLTLLDKDVAAVHHAVLLVDMSGKLDEDARRVSARGAAAFVQKVRRTHGVSVFAFDGSSELVPIGEFEKGGADPAPTELEPLVSFSARDPSRNFNGALLEGMKRLDGQLMAVKKPVRIGALVVLARGPDLAGRTTGEELSKKIEASGYDVIAVGIGQGELPWLDDIGRFAVVRALTPSTVGVALEEAGAKALQARDRYYLLSYCSPSRAGKRWARIDVNFTSAGGSQRTGSVEHEFDATGFTAGCDAKAPPSFAVAQAEIDKAAEAKAAEAKAREEAAQAEQKKPRQREPSKAAPRPAKGNDEIVPPPENPTYQP
jgi:hypothetical protein